VLPATWQAPQLWFKWFVSTNAANAAPECGCEISPGLMKPFRHGGLPSMIKSKAQDAATTAIVNRPRSNRNVGTGEHFAIGRQQLPSGNGPDSQAPPVRVHRQRPLVSPGLSSRIGLHSAVAQQRPFASGPGRQALPSQARPQIQFWFGLA